MNLCKAQFQQNLFLECSNCMHNITQDALFSVFQKQKVFPHLCPASLAEHPQSDSISPKARRTKSVQIILNLVSEEGKTLPVSPKQHNQDRKASRPSPSPFLAWPIRQHACDNTCMSNSGGKIMLSFRQASCSG